MAKLVSDKDEEVVELADLFDLARVPHPPWLGLRPDGSKSDLKDDVWYLGDQLSGAAKSSGNADVESRDGRFNRSAAKQVLGWPGQDSRIFLYGIGSRQ